jgi:glycine betaine/proline transport system permease protein
MLDRISEGFGKKDFVRWAGQSRAHKLQPLVIFVALVGLATALGFFAFPYNTFPLEWRALIRGPIDAGVRWVRDNFYWLTGGISDFLTIYLLNALRDLFLRLPWPVVVAAFTAIAYRTNAGRTGGWQLALGSALGLITIGLLGMWPLSMDTLSQVIITMLVTMLVALPLGVLASQFKWASAALRPINDFLQTIPTFVFLVPVLMLFNVGRVPGLIAAALYAIPVGIKLTELGLRQVAPESIEAARAFGSTRSQIITKVQLPLARTAISVAINQMIMMVLAMVIISGMVGGAGLGLEAVTGLARNQTGQGLEAGLAIVILAIVCDRISQAWAAARE